ncbi:MAG: methyltransferase domain-containing protein [Chloroflexi bacterium]|nr:methyltransferase domain-containing protein [Chloroflexota bacterium]
MTEKQTQAESVVDFLLSAHAADALAMLAQRELASHNHLSLLTELRATHTAEQAAGLLTLATTRQRAVAKFPDAARLFFTPEALEQATAWPIAQHRAVHLHSHAPPGPVLDLGCGIGGDTLALARQRPVIAYETDPVRLRFAQANAAALGLSGQVEFRLADWTDELAADRLPPAGAAFADPARRAEGRRLFGLEQMIPPLSLLLRLQARIPALGVKVAPGVADDEIPPGCGVEFISHERTCKEAVLWFGSLADGGVRRASVYDEAGWHTIDASLVAPPVGELAVGHYLHEPDPAVIRAGPFAELCEMLDAHLFDPQIAYLVRPRRGAGSGATPFVQSFLIEEIHPFSLKTLNRRLQALGIGQVELKRRGPPIEPESLRPRLKLVDGGRPGVAILTRRGEERLLLMARRV